MSTSSFLHCGAWGGVSSGYIFQADGNAYVTGNMVALGGANNLANIIFEYDWGSGIGDCDSAHSVLANDTSSYRMLMILGNRSSGGARRVGVWDYLQVNGTMDVTSWLSVNGDLLTRGQFTSYGVCNLQNINMAGRINFNPSSGRYAYLIWVADYTVALLANGNEAGIPYTYTYGGETFYWGALDAGAVFCHYLQALSSSWGITVGGFLSGATTDSSPMIKTYYAGHDSNGNIGGSNGGIYIDHTWGNVHFQGGGTNNSWSVFDYNGRAVLSIPNCSYQTYTYAQVKCYASFLPGADNTLALGASGQAWYTIYTYHLYHQTSSSSYTTVWDSIDDLAAVKGYRIKTHRNHKHQDVQEIDIDSLPFLKAQINGKTEDGYWDMFSMISFALGCLKQSAHKHDRHEEHIDSLVKRIDDLEAEIKALRGGAS